MKVVPNTNVIATDLNFVGNKWSVLDLARRKRSDLYLPAVSPIARSIQSRSAHPATINWR